MRLLSNYFDLLLVSILVFELCSLYLRFRPSVSCVLNFIGWQLAWLPVILPKTVPAYFLLNFRGCYATIVVSY